MRNTGSISKSTQMRAIAFQIMGFYSILYSISHFCFGVNFPFNLIKVQSEQLSTNILSTMAIIKGKFFERHGERTSFRT